MPTQTDLFGKWIIVPQHIVEEPIEKQECDHCTDKFPVDELKDYQGCLMVCDECYDKLEAEDKQIREEHCDHNWDPTFQGGDTYRCTKCGKETDMTEDDFGG